MNTDVKTDPFAYLAEPSTLVIKRWLPGPVERVWEYLADSELRRKWLASGDMTQGAGTAFTLTWRNDDLSRPSDARPDNFPAEHSMESKVVVFDPPRRLVFTWGEGTVTFDLEPKGEKVLLTLTHTGIVERSSKVGISAGWHTHLDILVAEVSGDTVSSFWSNWAKLKAEYETRIPQ